MHLERAEIGAAEECLSRAEDLLGGLTPYDWRVSWHRGLLALVRKEIRRARAFFDRVYWNMPGEQAPKVALGYCTEELGSSAEAERYYSAVWTRDRSEVSAAFGLARLCLSRGERAKAVAVLDQVPDFSRHFDAARIAAVRVLSTRPARGEPPTRDELDDALERLATLYLDSEEARTRLITSVQETALALGHPDEEKELRERLESCYRQLARQAHDQNEHDVLVDLANSVRPMSRI